MRIIEGGCLCGAVRYAARGEPINVRACHCRLCQRSLGASFNARALYHRPTVEITGPVTRYASSDDLDRGFCSRCGTTVLSERVSRELIGLTLGSMDDPSLCPAPEMHIWTKSGQAWLRFADDCPHYPEAAPR